MTPSPADVLLRAADIILARGLCQGALRDDDGRVCMEGAVQVAVISLGGSVLGNLFRDAMGLLDAAIPAPRYVPPGTRVVWFSDRPGRTARQAANMLRRAAATCESEAAVA